MWDGINPDITIPLKSFFSMSKWAPEKFGVIFSLKKKKEKKSETSTLWTEVERKC